MVFTQRLLVLGFSKIMTAFGDPDERFTEDDAKKLVKEADKNKDGKLSIEELVEHFSK